MNELARQKLEELLAQHGRDLWQDLRRCEALLRDYCGEFRRETSVLVSALRAQVPADLFAAADAAAQRTALARLSKRLHDNLGIASDAAEWAVAAWAQALGVLPAEGSASPAVVLTIERELVVAPARPGCYRTIGEALRAATPGTRVLVHPGFYREALVLDQPVEIVGQGSRGEITIVGSDESCVRLRAGEARLRGLTLCQQTEPPGSPRVAVEVRQGRLELDDCELTSNSLSCVLIHSSAAQVQLRGCHHRSPECGVLVLEQATARLEDCDIERNGLSGVQVKVGNLHLLRCEVHDQLTNHGVRILDNSQAVLEECTIHSNGLAGIAASHGARPIIRRSQIFDGREAGILFHARGQGTVEACEIFENASAGVVIKEGSTPTLRGCGIHHQPNHYGVFVSHQGLGVLEKCDLFANGHAGVGVRQGGRVILRSCRVHHHARHNGVAVYEGGLATLSECDILDNAFAGVELTQGSQADIRRSRIRGNGTVAIRASQASRGQVEECDLSDNTISAWNLDPDCRIIARNNRE
jgi:F-box protein 11